MRFALKRILVLVFALAIFFGKRRWAAGLFLALSVDGFQDSADCSTTFLGMNYTRCWVCGPAAGIQALCDCRCRWASIRSFGADIMGPCGWVSSARSQRWTSKNQRRPSIPEMD
eukprot:1185429-Prorocentrum_minimum.AAC.4